MENIRNILCLEELRFNYEISTNVWNYEEHFILDTTNSIEKYPPFNIDVNKTQNKTQNTWDTFNWNTFQFEEQNPKQAQNKIIIKKKKSQNKKPSVSFNFVNQFIHNITSNEINSGNLENNDNTLNYEILPNIPDFLHQYHCFPVHFKSKHNNKYLLFSNDKEFCDHNGNAVSNGIFVFNFKKNIYQFYLNYPKDIIIANHNQLIDHDNNILYLFGGKYNQFVTLNINKKQWSVQNISAPKNIEKYAVYISHQINEIHLIIKNKHFILDVDTCTYLCVGELPGCFEELIYVKSLKKLMVFGGICYDQMDKVYFCNVHSKNQKEYKWELFPLTIPHKVDLFKPVLGFDHIIFLFFFDSFQQIFDIYCMDLLYSNLYKSLKLTPKQFFMVPHYFINDHYDRGVLYFISESQKQCLLKLSLVDIIPSELYLFYDQIYEPLIYGYCQQMNSKYKDLNISTNIKQLILRFYTIFI
eukprot:482218_1